MFVPICIACQLRQKTLFHQVSDRELDFIASLKIRRMFRSPRNRHRPGRRGWRLALTRVSAAGPSATSASYGKRQISTPVPAIWSASNRPSSGSIEHSVADLTPVSLCVLEGRPIKDLSTASRLTLHLVRTLVEDQRRADERIVLLGHKSGPERLGYLMLETFERLRQRGWPTAHVPVPGCSASSSPTASACPAPISSARSPSSTRRVSRRSRATPSPCSTASAGGVLRLQAGERGAKRILL